ncbi:MAG TPA: OB-fold nucleic acid binding domain-containing protein, partial [Candidatus Nanoarchaeia archaeon]|nr:OB-fold nucleic acid binding domain-containing protein [Candidatus Nanoarchaeia archaeon]
GKKGRVCNAILEDGSGSITLTLWNDEIESLNVGDKVKLSNGWVSEFRGEKQISTGKFGQIEILEKGIPKSQPIKEEPLPAEEDVEFIKEEEKVG